LPIDALLKPGLNQAALLRKSIEGSWRIRVAWPGLPDGLPLTGLDHRSFRPSIMAGKANAGPARLDVPSGPVCVRDQAGVACAGDGRDSVGHHQAQGRMEQGIRAGGFRRGYNRARVE
jgi:hypothetical protein